MICQRVFGLLLVSCLLTGCTTTTITNLTPRQLLRNEQGIYQFEVALQTTQQTLREETLKPVVVIGFDVFPMESALVLSNRWEALIPIAADKKFVNYRYKFIYDFNRFGPRGQNSKLSRPYQLEITER